MRPLIQRGALVLGAVLGVLATPAAAHAQKALVYCPVNVDATGCNAIVNALAPNFALGVDRGYDGTGGTVDLKTVDLFAYSVFVVPSLADGATSQPYATLRDAEVAEHLKAALIGRIAMWSGTPDQGATNRALKDALIQNLAAWAGGAFGTAKGPGLVALLDASSSASARYDWVRAITPLPVTADANLLIYNSVRTLNPRGTTILTSGAGPLIYDNMATFGFQVPNGAAGVSLDAVGQTGTSVGGQVVLLTVEAGNSTGAVVKTDKDDYAPGTTVVITGSGWDAGETVKLTLHHDPLRDADTELATTADAEGRFTNTQFAPAAYDVDVRFVLTAVGQTSGRRAQTTFTDGNNDFSGTVKSSVPPNAPIAGAIVSCTAGCSNPAADTTDANGAYGFKANYSGTNSNVTLTVTATGYSSLTQSFAVTNGTDQTRNFTLTPASIGTTTVITSDSPDPSDPNENVTVAVSVQASSGTTAPTGAVSVSASGSESCVVPLSASATPGVASGTCNLALVASGTRTLTATYAGAGNFAGSSDTESHVVRQPTSLAVPNVTVAFGEAITVSATLTSNATGVNGKTITFTVDGNNYTGTTNALGVATALVSNPVGVSGSPYTIGATFAAGDATYQGATGSGTLTVTQAATTTALASAPNPSKSGQSVTFTATVTRTTGGSAVGDGSVTLIEGGSCGSPGAVLGSGTPLNASGQSQFTVTALTAAASPHTIVACYAGTANFAASSGNTSHNVEKAATTTAVISSQNPSDFGNGVIFTATVTTATPGSGLGTGTVTFKDGATALGTGTLDATGQATFPTSALAVGPHSITAEYGGDAERAQSTSAPLSQTVNAAATSTVLASSPNPSVVGASVTFTATVTSGIGTPNAGTVTFKEGAATLGTGSVDPTGKATLTSVALGVGTHSITADYSGGGNFAASVSGPLSHVVNQASSTTAVTSSLNPSVFGQSVTFTATVSVTAPGVATPTGSVQFKVDGVPSGSPVSLSAAGTAGLTTAALSVANHTIEAVYSGDANVLTSTGSLTGGQTVNKAGSATTVVSSLNPSVFGQSVTFTANVVAVAPGVGSPTGNVTFKTGTTTLATVPLASGTAAYSTSALAAGSHSITAEYDGDGNFNTSTSPPVSQTVNKAATTTALTSSASTTVFGESVTFTAKVTVNVPGAGTPTGTVEFKDGAVSLGTQPLDANGEAVLTTSTLAVGSHTLSATYSGSTNFETSTGTVQHSVDKASTTTTVISSSNPAVFGESVTFTATVAVVSPGAGTPTGLVRFFDGGVEIGSASLTGPTATFTTSSLSVATHSITASYQGDDSFKLSTSAPVAQVVNKASTATAVSTSVNPSVFGQEVTFTATVSVAAPGAGTPTGTVTFKDGGTTLGTGTVGPSGTATFATSSLAVNAHSITAVYGGDGNFNPSTSNSLDQIVDKAETISSVVGAPNSSVFGQPVTFTATVVAMSPGAGTPTGTVTFKDAGTPIGTATLSAGTATLITAGLSVSLHSITVEYGSDANFNGSTSAAFSQTVNKASTATALSTSKSPTVFGESVTFTATVSVAAPGAGTPTGAIVFKDGLTTLATVSLSGLQATYSTSALTTGSHSITAEYSGDVSFEASTGAATQQVDKANTAASVVSSLNPSLFGQAVTFTATVSVVAPGAGTPTGTVKLLDGGVEIGSTPLAAGAATFTTATLAVATHSITVEFTGDGNFNGSTSGPVSQVVNKAPTVLSDLAVSQSIVYGAAQISLSGKIASTTGPVPNGSVAVQVGAGATVLAPINPETGEFSATYATNAIGVAGSPYTITYAYEETASFLGTSDASTKLSVTPKPLKITANDRAKTYGDVVIFSGTEFTPNPGDLINGDQVTSVTLTSPGAAANAGVAGSPYDITPSAASGTGLANYAITYTVGKLAVNPKVLVVTATASPSSVAYPTSPTLGVTYDGFVNNETAAVLGGAPVLTVRNASNVPVVAPYQAGLHTVTPSGLTPGNYTFTYVNGTFTVTNDKPVISSVTGPDPASIGAGGTTSVTVNVAFTDPGVATDQYAISSVWTRSGGGSQNFSGVQTSYNGAAGSGAITGTGLIPGVYTVVVTVTDKFNSASDPFEYRYVVVYDPNGGFVTGGGWIMSPAGAYMPEPTLAGKATFGFISKYQKGQTKPTGNTEFQFHAASMNFKSTDYDWLVIAGTSKAQYKGIGTINGEAGYAFLLSAIDGDNLGNKKPDTFRIKIWKISSGAVVYDNNFTQPDELADPTTILDGGSIQIKSK